MLTDLIAAGANPYVFWGKVVAAAAVLAIVATAIWYVVHTFSERNALHTEVGKLQTQLIGEKQKVEVALEQAKVWRETVAKMNQALKNIKVESDVYIQNVENSEAPVVPDNGTIPFIMPTAGTDSHGFVGYSSGRVSPATAPRRPYGAQ